MSFKFYLLLSAGDCSLNWTSLSELFITKSIGYETYTLFSA